ncbi:phosphodiesterase [Rhodoligotrophos defluvii]|uniref:phosphodiesterase n=1 Tax=Rhodoligotrophos defluvii TaxID=2561934 RepID=UPI0010C9F488|nr:phosphodiesterase [Rhodoligotrophos defluvii]
MKIIHMSDLHLVAPGNRLWGIDPWDRFLAALRDIARHHGDTDFCVITGDLTNDGDTAAYAALKGTLGRFPIPTLLTLGPHDRRDAFFAVFGEAPRDGDGFAQFTRETEDGLFVFLDTLDSDDIAGDYCVQRQAWLSGVLARAHELPVYVFAHHPPFDVDVPLVDRTKLKASEALADILAEHAVHHLFFGHVHRPVFCTWQGLLCSGVPGMAYQAPLVAGSVSSPFSIEPPMYAVARIEGDRTVVHFDAFMHRHSADMRERHVTTASTGAADG